MISMKKQIPIIIISTAIIVTAILFAGFRISGPVPTNVTTTVTPSLHVTPDLNRTNFYLKYFPADTRDEIQTLAVGYSINISYWGFDPLNNEINLYDYGIQNESILKELRGKKIGNYTVHVMNSTEILNAQDEVQNQLFRLQKDPKYQIVHITMGPDLTINPTRYYTELWCYSSTPENKKLDNAMIKGWRIAVYPVAPLPSYTDNSSKSISPK
jgi:hypothetical protein